MNSPVRTSEQTDKLDAAMAAAQAELENPTKAKTASVKGTSRRTGKDFEIDYAYADIADVLAAVRPVLGKHGVAVFQVPRLTENMRALLLTTRLSCNGQWLEGDYPVCETGGDHQEMGKAMTYARRHALGAMVGVAPESDTDGQGAAKTAGRQDDQGRPRVAGQGASVRPGPVAQTALAAINTATSRAELKAWDDLHAKAVGDMVSAEEWETIGATFKRRWTALPPSKAAEPEPPPPPAEPEPEAEDIFPGDLPAHDPATGEVTE